MTSQSGEFQSGEFQSGESQSGESQSGESQQVKEDRPRTRWAIRCARVRQVTPLILAGLLVGLMLSEALVGWLHPQLYQRPDVWQFDPQLGWSHIPGSSGRLVTPEFDVEISINRDGLRDADYPRDKPVHAHRILLFGDSFVEGWGIRQEDTVAKVLERRLRADSLAAAYGRTEVINFGVAGYGTDQALLLFGKQGRHYQPDRVIAFFYGNDLWNNALSRGIGSERGLKPRFRIGKGGGLELSGVPVKRAQFWDRTKSDPGGSWSRVESYLTENWHFYVLLRKALAPASVPRGRQGDFYGALYGADPGGRYRELWALTGRVIGALGDSVRDAGAQLLLVYVPAIVQIEEENWRMKRDLHELTGDFDLTKPNRYLLEIASREKIPLLDLYKPFRKEALKGRTLYYRDSHWNVAGHALAADEISEFVIAHLLTAPGSENMGGAGGGQR